MNKKDLLREIYTYGYDRKLKLNIKKHNYTIKDLWNVNDGILVSIVSKNSVKSKYVDNLNLTDKMLVYNKLLRLDIYKNMKVCYPEMELKDVVKLTDRLQKRLRNQYKVFHIKG